MSVVERILQRVPRCYFGWRVVQSRFEARLQQEVLGLIGVNLFMVRFYKNKEPKKLLRYLYDNIDQDSIEIDTINFKGPPIRRC